MEDALVLCRAARNPPKRRDAGDLVDEAPAISTLRQVRATQLVDGAGELGGG